MLVRSALRTGLLALTFSCAALAQTAADDATRVAARGLAQRGLDAYDAGAYEDAAKQLGSAFAAVKIPSVGLWLARSLVKTGRLVEASERYGEVTRLKIDPGQDADTQERAKKEAATEQQALLPRIPTLSTEIVGADPAAVEVMVDGAKIPSTLVSTPWPVDPGQHRVVAKLGPQEVTEEVSVAEGEQRSVTLRFSPDPAPAAPGPEDQGVPSGSWQRTAGWVGIGVGGVGVLVGSITGLMALSRHSSLGEKCPDDRCGSAYYDDADAINSLRTVSTVGFIVGGVGAAAGVTLLLTAPKSDRGNVAAWVGLGSAGLRGSF
jgi:hypothetical protein